MEVTLNFELTDKEFVIEGAYDIPSSFSNSFGEYCQKMPFNEYSLFHSLFHSGHGVFDEVRDNKLEAVRRLEV